MAWVNRNNRGFTLVEILVSLAILSIVIVPVIGLFSAASRSSQKSIRNTAAITVARDIMDRIKAGDINAANIDREIAEYKALHGVEIFVPSLRETSGNSLSMISVSVTPRAGMNPKTEGIMLASYAANVFINEIDTTQLYQPLPSKDKDYEGISHKDEGTDALGLNPNSCKSCQQCGPGI